MTSPIDNNVMPAMSGGKGKRNEEAGGQARKSAGGAVEGGATVVGDKVNISSAGSQLNASPRVRLDDATQAMQMAQRIKSAFAENPGLALSAQGVQVKGELQGLL